MRLLLASKSPRRRQLLAELGLPVEIVSVDVDEHLDTPLPAHQVAEHLACRKSSTYPIGHMADDEVLVTADTVVVLDGQVLGKPADRAAAVSCWPTSAKKARRAVCAMSVSVNAPLSDRDIDYYVDHYRPFDKAGAYGIQEWIGMIGVSRIEGCFYNVMGLPVARLYAALNELVK